jgi:hypothetical protein
MAFDPYGPYWPLVNSTVRGRRLERVGALREQWRERRTGIEDTLCEAGPGSVCLVEA